MRFQHDYDDDDNGHIELKGRIINKDTILKYLTHILLFGAVLFS